MIALGISMARGGDIIALGKALGAASAEIRAELPAGCTVFVPGADAEALGAAIDVHGPRVTMRPTTTRPSLLRTTPGATRAAQGNRSLRRSGLARCSPRNIMAQTS